MDRAANNVVARIRGRYCRGHMRQLSGRGGATHFEVERASEVARTLLFSPHLSVCTFSIDPNATVEIAKMHYDNITGEDCLVCINVQ